MCFVKKTADCQQEMPSMEFVFFWGGGGAKSLKLGIHIVIFRTFLRILHIVLVGFDKKNRF